MEKVTQSQFIVRVLQISSPDYCIVKFSSTTVSAYSALQSPFFCKASNYNARKHIFDSLCHVSSVGIMDVVGDFLPP